MAGIFDRVNGPNNNDPFGKYLNASFVVGIIIRNILGLDNNVQSLALINLELTSEGGNPLSTEGQEDFAELIVWVSSGTGTVGKEAHLAFLSKVLELYEQSKPDGEPWINETEARQLLNALGAEL